MPKFRYIVVNKADRQLSGVVDAPDVDTARSDLQDLGFSIVSIEEEKKAKKEETGMTFEFTGVDSKQKNISGTIKSESRYQAFRRLITEYDLDVRYVVQNNLKEKEKEEQKNAGVIDLMRKYQEEVKSKTDLFHKEKIKKVDRSFEKQKALVMRQLDFVLNKVNEAVEKFAKELNPQDKQTIKDYVNKILRLKNTTNLDYLKKTSMQLLKFLQNAEIFVSKKSQIGDKISLYAESQDMIDTIQRGKDFGIYEDLEDQITRWKSEHIKDKKKISFGDRIKDIYYTVVLKVIHEDEEVRTIKKQINHLNRDLKQYYNVYIKAKDPTYRKESLASIKALKTKKNNLKAKLNLLKTNARKKLKAEGELNHFENFVNLINGLSGWLLFFYLLYYFAATIIISKEVGFAQNDIPSVFYLFNTGTIKYILPVIFLLHITTSVKLSFFKKNFASNLVLFPVFAVVSLLIVFNF